VGDAGRLRQILLNLISNAIKFTESGEVVVRVSLDSGTEREVRLHFAVSDTGIGIPPDKQRLIFDAFTQADSSTSRQHGGTGVGLAICSQLVDLMDGRIWVESEAERGSVFHFIARFGVPQSPGARRAPDLITFHDRPVLAADDNATNRRIL